MEILIFFGFCFTLVTLIIVSFIYLPDKLNSDLLELLYLVCKGELKHYIAKRHLTPGDLVFVQYRGALRKALVTTSPNYANRIEVKFYEKDLNTIDNASSSYHFSRVYLPEFLGKASKILYGVGEK